MPKTFDKFQALKYNEVEKNLTSDRKAFECVKEMCSIDIKEMPVNEILEWKVKDDKTWLAIAYIKELKK